MKIANRSDLVALAADRGARDTAEIGVYDGKFSEVICHAISHFIPVKHLCVDTWAPSRNHRNTVRLEQALSDARERLKRFNVTFLAMPSVNASELIPDDSLDFVYIDAAHDYISVLQDIIHWEPKVRLGGILAGHDYGTEYHQTRCVKKAVDDYFHIKGKPGVNVTDYCEEDITRSWFWIKGE